MTRTTKLASAGAVAVLLAGVGLGVAGGLGDDADEQARGPAADRARAAALVLVPGGTVTGVEHGEEDGATWEVELRRPDGAMVEVELGADLRPAGPAIVEAGDD